MRTGSFARTKILRQDDDFGPAPPLYRLSETELFTTARVYLDMPRAEAAQRMYVDDEDTPVDVHVEVAEKQSWFVAPIASLGRTSVTASMFAALP
jgi:hypothetical protein